MNMKKTIFCTLASGLAIAAWGLPAPGEPGSRVIEPCRVEVAYAKTVHILFPAAVRYVDLGSTDLVAGKADGAENVLRIKAAVRGFEGETNFSVITDDGVFYAFDAVYADAPARLSIVMREPSNEESDGSDVRNEGYVRLQELGDENPQDVNRLMRSIYAKDARLIRNIGSRRFGVQFLLRGIYVQGDLFYLHTLIRNTSNIDYDIDRIRFRIADRKVARRTALQETLIEPVRTLDDATAVKARGSLRNVFVLRKFSIPDDKVLIVDLLERDGGRHQSFIVQNSDFVNAPAAAKTQDR